MLGEVLNYAQSHFDAEETYMKKIGYPDLDEHIKQHKKLSHVLSAYKSDFNNNKINLFAFKNFLFVWVKDHIMDEDIKIGRYIKDSEKHLD